MAIESIDPRTEEVRERFEPLDARGIEVRLGRAERAFSSWRRVALDRRAETMRRAGDLLLAEKAQLGRTMTEEMGKTLASAIAEAEKCAHACHHFAGTAARDLADEPGPTEARSFVRHLPLGAVLAVMPWNFPFWQVFRFVAPALMAGNVGLLKHASNVPRCALAIEDLLLRAGFPEGVFQTLLIGADAVPGVLDDRRVVAATLTGSEAAGQAVAARAGKALKPTVLELGGSDPFIVMPSADLDAAVRAAVTSRTLNNGQSCINAKRFLVHRDVYASFEERLCAAFTALRVGDPMAAETDVGPLALRQVQRDVVRQVGELVAGGARRLVGCEAFGDRGFWFRPGVLVDLPSGAPTAREEIFGPVASLFPVASVEHALQVANDSDFGLGSSVWTHDEEEIEAFVNGIEAGQTFVNAMVASDARLPFGGIKRSGYGRELGVLGLRAFTNTKTVVFGPAR